VELVDHVVSLAGPQCHHAGIALAWQAPGERLMIRGDPEQLSHLLGNVIDNAVQAAGPGGTVEIRIPTRRVSEGSVVIEVSDSGPGPPAEIAAKLFEPFVTGKPEGIGLGLAIAKQAAEAHGGRLSWERREGKTVFRIELPVRSRT